MLGNIYSKDQTKLSFRANAAPSAQGTVVLIHGFAEHCGRYDHVTERLNAVGLNVFALDLRGHGLSAGLRGQVYSIEEYFYDLDAGINAANEHFKDDRLFLVAHSMGGMLAAMYAARNPRRLQALALSSPLFGVKIKVAAWKRILGKIMSNVFPDFGLPHPIKGKQLTHDPILAKEYDQDPLIFHTVRARWFTEILAAEEEASSCAPKIKLPILVQASENDMIVCCDATKNWYGKLRTSNKKYIGYSNFLHEIYNEAQRDIPINDLCKWLKDQMAQQVAPEVEVVKQKAKKVPELAYAAG